MKSRYLLPMLVVFLVDMMSPVQAAPIDFAHEVVPILKKHCTSCHGGREAKGSFSLNTRELWLESGFVDPKDAKASYVLELVTSSDPEMQMPPKGKPRLSAKEVAILKQWISDDLPWEAGFSFGVVAYEPPLKPRRPALPPAEDCRTHPIDRLIDQYLSQ
ncbi:MAG: c-type cytochrome, partial [Planctomycetaceae bacterium]|nr:c-type cytochrome [Planctomycetaceae bacterium]